MIDVLVLNPNEHANTIVQLLEKHSLTFEIYCTPGMLFGYNMPVVLPDDWNDAERFKSIIGFNSMGWLDHLSKQVLLQNSESTSRNNAYIQSPVKEDNSVLFNFVSYKGQHVLLDSFIFKNSKWGIFKNSSLPLFVNGVNSALSFLNEHGVLNGPAQVYRLPNGQMSLLLAPRTLNYGRTNKTSTKSFADIWPLVIKKESSTLFSNWAYSHGNLKKFTVPVGS